MASLTEQIRRVETEKDEFKRTVERVWRALGMTSYEQCKPFTIWEHCENLRRDLTLLYNAPVPGHGGLTVAELLREENPDLIERLKKNLWPQPIEPSARQK